MRRAALAFCITVVISPIAAEPAGQRSSTACRPPERLILLKDLPEASGVTASHASPGRLWALNDSGKPEIFSFDSSGRLNGHVAVSGATVEDWEAISSARCGTGPCLFIADIGDNGGRRRNITIYRIAEPPPGAASVKVDAVLHATYPDGAQDAEALLATRDGTLYIVTKGETGGVALYRLPRDARAGEPARLERIGPALAKGRTAEVRITDGAISPDGELVALRTRESLAFYRAADFLKGDFRELRRADLRPIREPQGEGVAFGPGDTIYLAGEGGGKSQAGTLAVLSCPR
jgi:hypothetical protein